MNKRRELYLLFPYVNEVPKGYTLIHKHTFLNDEPPYKTCSFFDVSSKDYLLKSIEIETHEEWCKEESYKFYLIRTCDAQKFIDLMNQTEKDYLDDIYQYQVERSYDDGPRISNSQIEKLASSTRAERRPKVRYMKTAPIPKI
jgi:hypothetical protein